MLKMKSKPNIAIIDEAIRRVREGIDRHSCVALSSACDISGGHYWGSSDDALSGDTYRTQYRLVMTDSKGKLPKWWDKSRGNFKEERVAALKKFKAACIAAGEAQ